MATLAEVSYSVDMDQDEVKVRRKKEKKGKKDPTYIQPSCPNELRQ